MSIAASSLTRKLASLFGKMAWEVFEALGASARLPGNAVRQRQGNAESCRRRSSAAVHRILRPDCRSRHGGDERFPAIDRWFDHAQAAIEDTWIGAGRVLLFLARSADAGASGQLDLTVDPPPDLAIDVDISRSSIDKLSILPISRTRLLVLRNSPRLNLRRCRAIMEI